MSCLRCTDLFEGLPAIEECRKTTVREHIRTDLSDDLVGSQEAEDMT